MENIDDLQNGYYVIQKEGTFKFGVDAVLLSEFADIKHRDRVVDLGTGTGIIPILLYAKKRPKEIIGVEIQENMAEMAGRSIALNKLEETVKIETMNLKDAPNFLGRESFDGVTANPPYVKIRGGINNPDIEKAIARFEIECNLADVVESAKALLKQGGKFFMVHRADRLIDVITTMREKGVEPKRLCFVHPRSSKRPNLILVEGVKGGKADLKILDPIYVYDEEGNYTKQIQKIYGRQV